MGIAHQRQHGKLQRRTPTTSTLPRLCYFSSPVSPKGGTLARKLLPSSLSTCPCRSFLQRLGVMTSL